MQMEQSLAAFHSRLADHIVNLEKGTNIVIAQFEKFVQTYFLNTYGLSEEEQINLQETAKTRFKMFKEQVRSLLRRRSEEQRSVIVTYDEYQ